MLSPKCSTGLCHKLRGVVRSHPQGMTEGTGCKHLSQDKGWVLLLLSTSAGTRKDTKLCSVASATLVGSPSI